MVYAVQQVIKNFDYLYLRSRGYDVKMDDWKYGTVSLSVLEDQERADTLAKAVENLENVAKVFKSVGIEEYNKNYMVESILSGPLSATGIDVKEMLKVPEGQEGGGMEGEGLEPKGDMPAMASIGFKQAYLTNMLDTMENTKLASTKFITAARQSIAGEKKVITSGTVTQSAVSYSVLDDGDTLMFKEDTPVDLTGQVFFMDGTAERIASDFTQAARSSQEMATLDFGQTVLIPSDMKFTVGDFNSAGVRALTRGYINSRGELALVDKADVVSYLHMKKSGGFTCLVSRLYEVP